MRMALQIFIGIPVMVGLYFVCRWLATGISMDFGLGLFTGLMVAFGLVWLVQKIDPKALHGRDKSAL